MILNIVGIILLLRWHKFGLWVCVIAALGECLSLIIWGFPLDAPIPVTSFRNYIPLLVVGGILLLVLTAIFLGSTKPSGKIPWNEMKEGSDMEHTRHIYQIACFLILSVATLMWLYSPEAKELEEPVPFQEKVLEPTLANARSVDINLLDSANVTFDEIVSIEPMIENISVEKRQILNARLFALRHVLLSGLMTDKHNTMSLINIFKIHAGEFSESQQKIIDWYLSLPDEKQVLWLDCGSVNSLQAFHKVLKEEISNHESEKKRIK